MTPIRSEEIEMLAGQAAIADNDKITSQAEKDNILAAWIEEAERRSEAFDRGEMGVIDFEESLARARARIHLNKDNEHGSEALNRESL